MERKHWLMRLVVALAVAVPLVMASTASAESGCHRGNSGPSQTPPASR